MLTSHPEKIFYDGEWYIVAPELETLPFPETENGDI